jgi:hypothetical protein
MMNGMGLSSFNGNGSHELLRFLRYHRLLNEEIAVTGKPSGERPYLTEVVMPERQQEWNSPWGEVSKSGERDYFLEALIRLSYSPLYARID